MPFLDDFESLFKTHENEKPAGEVEKNGKGEKFKKERLSAYVVEPVIQEKVEDDILE